jgi:hypothetical protein
MTDNFWINDSEELIVSGSDEPVDCAQDPCRTSVCVGNINFGYVCRTSFNFNGVVTTPAAFNLLWDQGINEVINGIATRDTWSGGSSCSGHNFRMRVYCKDEAWFFDLLDSLDNDYANPALPGDAGGATLLGSSPVHVFGEIT